MRCLVVSFSVVAFPVEPAMPICRCSEHPSPQRNASVRRTSKEDMRISCLSFPSGLGNISDRSPATLAKLPKNRFHRFYFPLMGKEKINKTNGRCLPASCGGTIATREAF